MRIRIGRTAAVAALISVPIQLNYDQDFGPDSGPEGFGSRLIVTLLFPT